MKAGIYIVKDTFSEKKYILSLNGKEPFIRITNNISLNSFANGIIEKDHEIVKQILEDPNKFEFTLLSKEIESNQITESKEIEIEYTDEQYEKFIDSKNIQPDGNLNKIAVTADIQGFMHISWENAQKIFDKVNIRYLNNNKWNKIKEKSSINEANSVIQ